MNKIQTFLFSIFCTLAAVQAVAEPVAANIQGANGMYFDAQDHLYVASLLDGTVRVLDSVTGETLKILNKYQGVESPDDVFIDDNGIVYVTNLFQGTVVAIKPDGSFSEVANLGKGVNSITMGNDGLLWVGRDFLGDGLYKIALGESFSVEQVFSEPGWINAMDFGPDGMLYGPVFKLNAIVRINPVSGKLDIVAKGFEAKPLALKFNHQGDLYALIGKLGRVVLVDIKDGSHEMIAEYPAGLDNLAFDSQDRLFISSYEDGSIHEVYEDGTFREVAPPSESMASFNLKLKLGFVAALAFILLVLFFIFRVIKKLFS